MSQVKATSIEGDVAVGRHVTTGGDIAVRGSVSVKKNLRVDGWLDARNIRGVGRGLYPTPAALRQAEPRPHEGWWALVGDTLPAALYVADAGEWVPTGTTAGQTTIESVQNRSDIVALLSRAQQIEAGLAAETAARTEADRGFVSKTYVDEQLSTKANKTYVDTQLDTKANQTYVDEQLSTKANQTYVNEQLGAKADQADFDKVAHLKNSPAIYRLWEAHNVDTVSINYNARKKADVDGSIIDAGGVTLPSATPYTNTPDGPTGGNAGVMTAQQATDLATLQSDMELANDELETHSQRLDALTPVVLTQAEYDALVAAGTVRPNQHYAIIEGAEA